MNILVTGGAGYIGSNACKALANAGYTPIAYDSLIYGHESAVKWSPLEVGDIADRRRLGAVIEKYQPDAVMHFAGYAHVGESMQNPGKYYRNNVAGTLELFEVMCGHGIEKLIFSSICATYGVPEQVPIAEDHPQRPINPYGMSKLMIENVLRDFYHAHGLRSISLRYFNAAGADPDGEIGESHDPETHLIPLVLDAAAGIRPGVTVFGDDYDTLDGTCVRDYVHVSDLADAHVLAIRYFDKEAGMSAYNLGNGTGFSVREVIQAAQRVSSCAVPFAVGPRRQGDPGKLVSNPNKYRDKFGWHPRITNLEDIIATAFFWNQSIAYGRKGFVCRKKK